MFVSFFPRPKLFFWSAAAWSAVCIAFWYGEGRSLAASFGAPAADALTPVGVEYFWSPSFLWFDLYFLVATLLFAAFWMWFAPHRWSNWSILGSALILFTTYFQVQVSVAINAWYGPFFDLIQKALSKPNAVQAIEFYRSFATFAGIAAIAIVVISLSRFFVSHYIFRWRTAMNEYYMSHWPTLRHIEGASQRVQDDTMRFSTTMESLGVSLVEAVMTLFAFLPVLVALSGSVKELPIIGPVSQPLVVAALLWSAFGTAFLALVGIRLPGLEFRNQRVEAAYRKELVYGEDDPAYAKPPTTAMLFDDVRQNYFRLYLNYAYFNVARIFYINADSVFAYIILIPTLVSGAITFGLFNQIANAFDQVRLSFQYLVNSWSTIVELLSIYKRLRGFEEAIEGVPIPAIAAAEPA